MGYEKYRAKKTYYDGRWYDSNLEAKVAEALDRHSISYEYQRQCFRDRRFTYGQYTPDFHVPDLGGYDVYVEVMGYRDERHQNAIETLSSILRHPSYLFVIDGNGNGWAQVTGPNGEPDTVGWFPELQAVAREAGYHG